MGKEAPTPILPGAFPTSHYLGLHREFPLRTTRLYTYHDLCGNRAADKSPLNSNHSTSYPYSNSSIMTAPIYNSYNEHRKAHHPDMSLPFSPSHLQTLHPVVLLPQIPRLLLPRLLLLRIQRLHLASLPPPLQHPVHLVRHATMCPVRRHRQELKRDHCTPDGFTDTLRRPAEGALRTFGMAQAMGDAGGG